MRYSVAEAMCILLSYTVSLIHNWKPVFSLCWIPNALFYVSIQKSNSTTDFSVNYIPCVAYGLIQIK